MNSNYDEKKYADFLAAAGWGEAKQEIMRADASTKCFHLLTQKNGRQALLMNMPVDETAYSAQAALAQSCRPFLAIGAWLAEQNISVPKTLAVNMEEGLILMEDLGRIKFDGSAAHIQIAIDILLHLHQKAAPKEISFAAAKNAKHEIYRLPIFTPDIFTAEARLLVEWFLPQQGIQISPQAAQDFDAFWRDNFDSANFGSETVLLRDYHSPNLLFMPERSSYRRLGVIDYQDALSGPRAYDLMSLLQDARMTISPGQEEKGLKYYLSQSGLDEKAFLQSYALLGAQRAAKILGIFVRFAEQDQKPSYLKHLPRVISYLKRNLAHEKLAPLARWMSQHIRGIL